MDPILQQPQNPNPMSPPELPPVSPRAKHVSMKLVWAILIVLILASAGYGAIWWWGNQQTSQEVVATFTPRPSASADPTTNWQTYNGTSGKFSYEFKYPFGWPTPLLSQEEVYSIFYLGPRIPLSQCDGQDCYNTNFSITTAPLTAFGASAPETPEKVLTNIQNNSRDDKLISDSIRQDGSRIIVQQQTTGTSIPLFVIDLFYPSSQRQLHVKFTQQADTSAQIETILSTFKFTNSADTSTWQTYMNSYYELKYPENWKVEYEKDTDVSITENPTDKIGADQSFLISSPYYFPEPSLNSLDETLNFIKESTTNGSLNRYKEIAIGNGKAFYGFTQEGQGGPFVEAILASNHHVFRLTYEDNKYGSTASQQLEFVSNILSTFKFTK